MLDVVVWSWVVSCVQCVKVTVRLAGSCQVVCEGLMTVRSGGLVSQGFWSEMILPALWPDCIKKCSYVGIREVYLRRMICINFFFYWTVLVLIVEDMDSICRL